MKPSCRATGTPIFTMSPRYSRWGRRWAAASPGSIRRRTTTMRDSTTLNAWLRVVPSAAPAGPRASGPMNSRSSPILAAQAAAMKYMGLLESPMPRKMALMTL